MSEEAEKSLVSILMANVKGVLAEISEFFSSHNLNISRLTISAADRNDKVQKAIVYLEGERKHVDEVCKKLLDIENVLKIVNFQTNAEYLERETCLIKLLLSDPKLPDVTNLVTDMNGKTIFTNQQIVVYKMDDTEENVNEFVRKLTNITMDVEISRSGMIAMSLDGHIDNVIDIDL